MDLAATEEEDRLTSLPVDVLSEVCKMLALHTNPDEQQNSDPSDKISHVNDRAWYGLRNSQLHHGRNVEENKKWRMAPDRTPINNKALRSCCRVLRTLNNETQTSISIQFDQQSVMDSYLRTLPNLRKVSIRYTSSPHTSVTASLTSLHTSLPALTCLGLHYYASHTTRIQAPLNNTLPLWGSTLQHLELHSIKCVLGTGLNPNSYSLGFLTNLPTLRGLVLHEVSPFLKTEDLANCTGLQKLTVRGFCKDWPLSLDLSALTCLEEVDCEFYSLHQLNVSGLTLLRNLECGRNSLTELDLSGCPALRELSCFENALASLDLSKNREMRALDCSNNPLTALRLNSCTHLKALRCGARDCTLTHLDLSGSAALQTLECYGMQFSSLDLQTTAQLEHLSVGRCMNLSALDLVGLTKLKTVNVDDCSILSSLDATGCTALQTLKRCRCDRLRNLILTGSARVQIDD